ncbi:myb-like protein X [Vespula maculifrons]|uniref:Myb-like protein X n=1 Tax=Vespula maculifrons TaxID=7453 RepID=A0ABD2AGE4_VESMC
MPWMRLGTIRTIFGRLTRIEVQVEGKDYVFTLVYDPIEDRSYLDADHPTDKSNSNQTDVELWPNIDIANLDLTSKIHNTVFRKKEGEWIVETYRD